MHHELECLKSRVSDKEKYVCELETKKSELEHEISRHVDYITKLEAESAMAKEQSQKEIDRLIKNLEEMDNNLKRYKDEIVNAADHTRKLLTGVIFIYVEKSVLIRRRPKYDVILEPVPRSGVLSRVTVRQKIFLFNFTILAES